MTKKEKVLIPLGNRVLLKTDRDEKKENKTSFGIIIPENTLVAKEKENERQFGRVVRISPDLGKKNISEGDLVVYSKFGFDKIKIEGEELILVDYENILAVFK